MSNEAFTWEQLWRQLALLLGGKYLMENGFRILELIFNVGMAAAASISSIAGPGSSENLFDAASLIEEFTSSLTGFYAVIGKLVMLLYLALPWALTWLMGIFINVISPARRK